MLLEVVTPSGNWDHNFLTTNLAHDFVLQVLALPMRLAY